MIKPVTKNVQQFAKDNFLSIPIAKILWDRDIKDTKSSREFINASFESTHDPFLMADMDKASEIIIKSIEEEKNIIIYGDYDVDGVSSSAIMYKGLKTFTNKVGCYIPHREKDGYGLNKISLKELKEKGAEVIITVDNGISAFEEVEFAKELGLTIIITDHHDVREKIPNADAVVNPKRHDCSYPFKKLCGAGVALKFLTALYIKKNIEIKDIYDELLQLAGIATVCDVVELIDENRVIVKEALKRMQGTKIYGLIKLKEIMFKEGEEFSVYNIGFKIGPCINASGRLENAKKAAQLLLAEDEKTAEALASELFLLNKERQELTIEGTDMIRKMVEKNCKEDKVILVYNEKIHESIAGIIAGRIKDIYYKPTIVLTRGEEMPKGSARSIEGYDIHKELLKCDDILEKFGGHPMAAGMSLKRENIERLRTRLNKNCNLTEEEFIPKITINYPLKLNEISKELIYDIERLEPFGVGNPAPIFADKKKIVKDIFIYGEDKNVIKFNFKDGANIYKGISFNTFEKLKKIIHSNFGEEFFEITPMNKGFKMKIPENFMLDVVYTLGFNEYMGKKEIILKIQDFRIS